MGEHFYTYPTVVELRSDRDRGISRGAAVDRRLQPPFATPGGHSAAQPQTRESEPTTH